MNYLSNGTFHTMISQAGGGVAFYKSPQIWRINHYKFFHVPTDRSGFYAYIKDGVRINAIGFGMGEFVDLLSPGDGVHIAAKLDINTYQGNESAQLVLCDIKLKTAQES